MIHRTDLFASLLWSNVARLQGPVELIQQELIAAEVGNDVRQRQLCRVAHWTELYGSEPLAAFPNGPVNDPGPLVLPSNSRNSSLSTSSFECNWQTNQWTGFP